MCLKTFYAFTCGHCSFPDIEPCPLVHYNPTYPLCSIMGQQIKDTLPYCPGCDREIWKHMVIAQENEHRERHLSGDICCSVIFPGEDREKLRHREGKGEAERGKDLSELATSKHGRKTASPKRNDRHYGTIKQDTSGGQRFEDVGEAMRNGKIDPREHWTAEARAVAYEYHRYQIGAGEGKQTPGRAAGRGTFGQGGGYGSTEELRGYGQFDPRQANPNSIQTQQPTQQQPTKSRFPQGPKAMGYQLNQHNSAPSLPALPLRGPKNPAYEPPQYHWTPPSSGIPSHLQSPIHFNQRIFDPAGEAIPGFSPPPYAMQDTLQNAGFAKYSVGYLPPPPPALTSLTDPTAILACQTHYTPVTPFQGIAAVPELPPTSPQSPKQSSHPSPSASTKIRPSLAGYFKVSDQDFHFHRFGTSEQRSRSRYAQSEPPCKSDLMSMAELLEEDSNGEAGASTMVGENEANENGAEFKARNTPVIVSSTMSQDL